MKTHFLLSVAALAASAALAAPAGFLDYAEALAAAKSSGKDIVLLEDGSNWAPGSSSLRAALADPGLRARLGDKVIWAYHDTPEEIDPPEGKSPSKKSAGPEPDLKIWNYPAVVLVGPDGRAYAVSEGVRPGAVGTIVGAAPSQFSLRAKRDELWKKAAAASGRARAGFYGAGLDLMPFDMAKERKDIREEIKKADPKDESGYTFKYAFDQSGISGFHEHQVRKFIDEKKYSEALALAESTLKNPVLTNNQRQSVMAARFQVYRAQEDLPRALAELKAIAAFDPRTDMASGARAYLGMHTEPVRLSGLSWVSVDNRPVWLPMVADVTKFITGPGTYEIEFKHREGHTRFRKVELRSGATVIAPDANPKESRKVKLIVSATAKEPKIELFAESRGTGWFDGCGDITVTKVD